MSPKLVAVSAVSIVAASAIGGTVQINPTSMPGHMIVSGRQATAQIRFSTNGWDMGFSPVNADGSANDQQTRNVTNNAAALASAWDFSLSFTPDSGYTFKMARAGNPAASSKIVWPTNAEHASVNAIDNAYTSGPDSGAANNARIPHFNFIRLNAHVGEAGKSLSFSNLDFVSALSENGALHGGVVTTTSNARASVDGSASGGSHFQDIISDVNLAANAWALTGRIQANQASNLSGFQIDLLDTAQAVTVAPLPSAAAMGLVAIASVGSRRRRR